MGIIGALSTVAVTQFGKYKKTAEDQTSASQDEWDSENCTGGTTEQNNQCLCEKGLAELAGLNPSDCCPTGKIIHPVSGICVDYCPDGKSRDASGNCVAFVAQAPLTCTPACTGGKTCQSGSCVCP